MQSLGVKGKRLRLGEKAKVRQEGKERKIKDLPEGVSWRWRLGRKEKGSGPREGSRPTGWLEIPVLTNKSRAERKRKEQKEKEKRKTYKNLFWAPGI